MVCCDELTKLENSKIFSISSAFDTFTILLFSLFLSFSLLDQFQINLKYILYYILHSLFSLIFVGTQGDLACEHTRRLSFSVSGLIFMGPRGDRACLYFLFLDQSSFDGALVIFFPVVTRDWCVFPSSTLQVG